MLIRIVSLYNKIKETSYQTPQKQVIFDYIIRCFCVFIDNKTFQNRYFFVLLFAFDLKYLHIICFTNDIYGIYVISLFDKNIMTKICVFG